MTRALRATLFALCAVLLWTAGASALEIPQNDGRFVTDRAGLLAPREREIIGAHLLRYSRTTGNQIVVLTVPSLAGEDMADYANRVARAWGVGQKDKNNGVLILVAAAEKRVRFEVGRGVEDKLPDITAKRIQREITVPAFRAGHYAQGIAGSIEAIEAALGPAEGGAGTERRPVRPTATPGIPWVTLGLILIGVVVMLALAGRRRSSRGSSFGSFGRVAGNGRGSSFFLGFLLGLLADIFRGRGGRGGGFGGGGFGGGGFGGGDDGGFSGGGGDFGGGGSDSGWGGDN